MPQKKEKGSKIVAFKKLSILVAIILLDFERGCSQEEIRIRETRCEEKGAI